MYHSHFFFSLQARLWVQVIRDLRQGVKLKKVEFCRGPPIEYELTPYEILMDDIRSRRYKLNKVMVDGALPPRIKKDAHAIILEFIRSRPPLRKVNNPPLFGFSIRLKYLFISLLNNSIVLSIKICVGCNVRRGRTIDHIFRFMRVSISMSWFPNHVRCLSYWGNRKEEV